MKYPIDPETTGKFFGHLIAHERSQRQMIQALTLLLQAAMDEMGMDDTEWYEEAEKLIKLQKRLKVEHETRLFNEKNGRAEPNSHMTPEIAKNSYAEVMPHLGIHGQIDDAEINAQINEREAKEFGGEMSEEEVAKLFQEKPKKTRGQIDMSEKEPFKNMTLEQIEEWEAKQNNNNDIYKVKARVQNLASGISGGNLTAVGTMMVNSFVHVVKDLYDFAETIPDKSLRIALIERVRKHESMPGTLIAAASAGVKQK